MESVILDRVTKSYTTHSTDVILDHAKRPSRTTTVLKDLSLELPIGRITAILGRSGCGKSTLLQLLDGSLTPDSGAVILPAGWHTALLRPDPYVITWTSVTRNVAMAAGAGRDPAERMALAEQLVELVGLADYADLAPTELSTGMRQRLGLARVLAGRAQLLLMDEPFASLDFITRGELQQELLRIQRELPRTIVLVTHQLEEALVLADLVLVLHGDSTVTSFDLTALPHPRDLLAPALLSLREDITNACKSK